MLIETNDGYVLRPLKAADYVFMCETLEDFPIAQGFNMTMVQNEMSFTMRLHKRFAMVDGLPVNDSGLALVLEYNGAPVAYRYMHYFGDVCEVRTQATHPDHRGQGHAAVMVRLCTELNYKHLNVTRASGQIRPSNSSGYAVYGRYLAHTSGVTATHQSKRGNGYLLKGYALTAQEWLDATTADSQIPSPEITVSL